MSTTLPDFMMQRLFALKRESEAAQRNFASTQFRLRELHDEHARAQSRFYSVEPPHPKSPTFGKDKMRRQELEEAMNKVGRAIEELEEYRRRAHTYAENARTTYEKADAFATTAARIGDKFEPFEVRLADGVDPQEDVETWGAFLHSCSATSCWCFPNPKPASLFPSQIKVVCCAVSSRAARL
jgi:hypothetical protein